MITEVDKLLKVINNEIGYKISKNNKYEYDLKYVYNVIDKNEIVEDDSQVFIIWSFIKAFGKVRAFELLSIPINFTSSFTFSSYLNMLRSGFSILSIENFWQVTVGDQIYYNLNGRVIAGILIGITDRFYEFITINNDTINKISINHNDSSIKNFLKINYNNNFIANTITSEYINTDISNDNVDIIEKYL